jgi:hypothetical protein
MAYARKQDFVPDFQAAEALAAQKYGAFYKKVDDEHGAMIQNFGVVNNSDNGSILLMGSALWNLTVNDCWVLGAVHSQLPFYPASTVSNANIFDDKYILSITGRELFGLALFGYR